MSRYRHASLLLLGLLAMGRLNASDTSAGVEPPAPGTVPSWTVSRTFGQLDQPKDQLLFGHQNSRQIEFTLRRDRIASEAQLTLDYTPSPALLPNLSHLRVYLNEVLMGTVTIESEQLGTRNRHQMALDPRLISDFNRVRIEFVGHYQDLCEDPGHSALWLNLAQDSHISLREQALVLSNDLAFFPRPFFDEWDGDKTRVNMVFAADPSLGEQRAAGILASYFGSLAGWRGTEFPVWFDDLPGAGPEPGVTPSVVFATNDRRPAAVAVLERFLPVTAPEVALIDHPADPFSKVLLVLGRHDEDLAVAARALALGGKLLRGDRVRVHEAQPLQPRRPYDAPNWIATDRPVSFAELISYPEQLQAHGPRPRPITLEVNLPPDLFVWRNQGIPLETKYRYTPPTVEDESRLSISLNEQFITSLPLSDNSHGRLESLGLAVAARETANASNKLLVPAQNMGAKNRLRYDFSFASTFGGAQPDRCQTVLAVDTRVLIDESSTIDLSGYHHFIAMPDLAAFARGGFPFSRMADLSETLVLMPATTTATRLGTLLETLAGIAAETGYPALALRLSDDWNEAREADADLLVFGALPEAQGADVELADVLQKPGAWLLQGATSAPQARQQGRGRLEQDGFPPEARVEVSARGPLAAIVGMQSPYAAQRSIVALLANDEADFRLLRATLGDSSRLAAVSGSVALIRASGVESQLVGGQYYVGYLPWWLKIWFLLSNHPVLLAGLTVLCTLLAAFLLWRALRWAAHRRRHEA
ncbi:cellulose biosynthesis cyclic di-GMP-binding regulatory protein BcsB [Zobellella sp. An-6]|uniref:cellulose biosynthesis cyclic di-GMP-binding regulatory protein BcsB n=1 Tax=Zobellella sp. An-6 TaxID=3400218 RepID=UPI0040424A91